MKFMYVVASVAVTLLAAWVSAFLGWFVAWYVVVLVLGFVLSGLPAVVKYAYDEISKLVWSDSTRGDRVFFVSVSVVLSPVIVGMALVFALFVGVFVLPEQVHLLFKRLFDERS